MELTTRAEDIDDMDSQLADIRAKIEAKRARRVEKDKKAAELAAAQKELAELSD